MRVNLPDYDRAGARLLQARGAGRRGVPLQDLVADLAGRDLAQRDDGRLVAVGLDERRGAGAKLARAIGRSERQLEAVRHSLQAIVDGDTSHTGALSGFGALAFDDVGELAPGGFEVVVNYS